MLKSIHTYIIFFKILVGVEFGPLMRNGLPLIESLSPSPHPDRNSENNDVLYEKLPADIAQRHVLLMDPILSTGHTTVQVIEVGVTWWSGCGVVGRVNGVYGMSGVG